MEEYEKQYRVGSGGQGNIFRVRHRKTNRDYAVKMFCCRDSVQMNQALREVKVLLQLRHEHIVSYIDFFMHSERNENFVCLVMELCENGDMFDKIREARVTETKLEEEKADALNKWLLEGLKLLSKATQYPLSNYTDEELLNELRNPDRR